MKKVKFESVYCARSAGIYTSKENLYPIVPNASKRFWIKVEITLEKFSVAKFEIFALLNYTFYRLITWWSRDYFVIWSPVTWSIHLGSAWLLLEWPIHLPGDDFQVFLFAFLFPDKRKKFLAFRCLLWKIFISYRAFWKLILLLLLSIIELIF